MEKYKKYKEVYPNKTDAQIIESLAWELSDKVETIHKLLAENEALRKPDVIKSVCDVCNGDGIDDSSFYNPPCGKCKGTGKQNVL